jgi:two-component system, NarL family, invasion response regulator UvrY
LNRSPAVVASGVRILLVEDHAIVREGFRRILADVFPDLVCGEAGTGPEAMAQVRKHPWDVVVLDISLPGRGGLEILKDLRDTKPRLPVLMMTMYPEDQYALRAFRAGASGYITKGSPPEDLVEAVRKVAAGGKYVSRSLAEHMATSLVSDTGRPKHELLSDRELQVLRMLAAGKTVKEIGFELHLSEKTVSTYRTRLLEKMEMRTTAELVRYAIRTNLVD